MHDKDKGKPPQQQLGSTRHVASFHVSCVPVQEEIVKSKIKESEK